jgi:hypothetical protein
MPTIMIRRQSSTATPTAPITSRSKAPSRAPLGTTERLPTRGSDATQRSVSAAGAVPKSLVPVAPVKICVVSAPPGEQLTFVVTTTVIWVAP